MSKWLTCLFFAPPLFFALFGAQSGANVAYLHLQIHKWRTVEGKDFLPIPENAKTIVDQVVLAKAGERFYSVSSFGDETLEFIGSVKQVGAEGALTRVRIQYLRRQKPAGEVANGYQADEQMMRWNDPQILGGGSSNPRETIAFELTVSQRKPQSREIKR
jgi:hypothetical protein